MIKLATNRPKEKHEILIWILSFLQLVYYVQCGTVSLLSVDDDYAKETTRMILEPGVLNQRFRRSSTQDKEHGLISKTDKSTKLQTEVPEITHFKLNNSHHQILIDWAGEGSKVVVCVTKDTEQNENSTTNVYISYDYGKTFQDKTEKFKVEDQPGIIYKFYKNDKFTEKFVFSDTVNRYLFVTNDYGHTIFPVDIAFTPSEVSMHPTNALSFLIMDKKDDMKKLWITTDFGKSWRVLARYVKSYSWSDQTSPPTLYIERNEPNQQNTVLAFKEFMGDATAKHEVVISEVEEFKVKGEFLFAVKQKKRPGLSSFIFRVPDATQPLHTSDLQLWISYRGGPFLLSQFPNDLAHQRYFVADVVDGQIMVCVFHGFSSNLYVSSVPRSKAHRVRFSLSLNRILYFHPGTNFKNSWVSDTSKEAFADLHRVKGVRGVWIASQLTSNFSSKPDAKQLSPEHLTSLITFDQGGVWRPLTPPKLDGEGKKSECTSATNCTLHISQELSQLYPGTQSRPILTTDSAPGIILSSGVLGQSLKGHTRVFLSTDAGVNWYEMLKGNYLYAIGDHGGVMLAVEQYRVNGITDQIIYSVDEGESWHSHTFFDEKIRVYGLMTEPGENTTIFTIFGSKLEKHEWIIVKVDMMPLFKSKCGPHDYKSWTPFDAASGRLCLLGRRDTYARRLPGSRCYNGRTYSRKTSTLDCPCGREDFECDFGFAVGAGKNIGECAKDKTDVANPFEVPTSCRELKFYNRTRGYRRIPGDSCYGGSAVVYEPELVACPVRKVNAFLLVSNRSSIFRVDLLSTSPDLELLPLRGLQAAIAIDFDLAKNCLYWSDAYTDKIMRECFNGEHQQESIVHGGIGSVEGLAVDWVWNQLYVVDGARQVIEVVGLGPPSQLGMRTTVIQKPKIELPRGIALHLVKGFLFFTDWSDKKPQVGRAHLDGSNVQTLFGSGQVGWPNGITIDFQTERIFWADAKLDYVASAELDGSAFKKVISNNANVRQPFAVGVHKNVVYWDDWNLLRIFAADKEHGLNTHALTRSPINGLVDLKVYGKWSQKGSNACGDNASDKCQFFCVGKPKNDYTCLCPDWLKTVKNESLVRCLCSDGTSPNESGACKGKGRPNSCPPDFFMCENGFCLPGVMRCNGLEECGDASDEKDCEAELTCGLGSFQCGNGHCISPNWKCDFDNDCGDNSDEIGCVYEKCDEGKFTCANQRCVDARFVCDLQDDCKDGSDEANCTRLHPHQEKCRSAQFECATSGVCLPISWRCDGEPDCGDASDEHNCTSHTCSPYQFQCGSKRCIYRTWMCDGDKDCIDGSDEVNCTTAHVTTVPPIPLFPEVKNRTCSSFEFRCVSGDCVPFWWRCDGAHDCDDASDEDNCDATQPRPTTAANPTDRPSTLRPPCREDQMECPNGECIWQAWVCDGDKDCSDGADEHDCDPKVKCRDDEFKCWHSHGCVPAKDRCNGRKDCVDGSDESGCSPLPPINATEAPCPFGFFSCDGGNCLASRKKCDHNLDCFDVSDEAQCGSGQDQVYQVSSLKSKGSSNTSLSFKWHLDRKAAPNDTVFEFLPSVIVKAALGNANAWKNGTWTPNTTCTFEGLEPFTTYLARVFVRDANTNKEFVPANVLTMQTEVGVPGCPTDVEVQQKNSYLVIRWKAPHLPNGRILKYNVYVSPPTPADRRTVAVSTPYDQYYIHYAPLSVDANFTIWLTCTNTRFTSPPTNHVNFKPSNVDRAVEGFSVQFKNATAVHLTWDAIQAVDGYIVTYMHPQDNYMMGKFKRNVTQPEIYLYNLSPGLKYVFTVRGRKEIAVGPQSTLEVTLPGQKLPILLSITSALQKGSGTSVKVSWKPPIYKQKHVWVYTLTFGKTLPELRDRVHALTTSNTTVDIDGLDACETYVMTVFISGPVGVGPDSRFQVITKEDPLSPPRHLKVKSQNETMTISWMPPCPFSPDASLRYYLTIVDLSLNKTNHFSIPATANVTQWYNVKMHPGGRYNVSVRTYLPRARTSGTINVEGPIIPPPFELTYNPSDNSFFWRNAKNFPAKHLEQDHSYMLYLSRSSKNDTTTADIKVEVDEPPFSAAQMKAGAVYYAYVAFKDQDGYMSKMSRSIRVERPIGDSIVVPTSSVVGVAVSVVLVILVLSFVVGVLIVRHKRLARSFSAFANSRYDPSQGTTHISTDHNLDEDDSPMIRGFSDDEPLVIA